MHPSRRPFNHVVARLAKVVAVGIVLGATVSRAADWDHSALRGTAAAATPFQTEPAFAGLKLGRCVALFPLPGSPGRLVAAELSGSVWIFADRDDTTAKDLFLRLPFGRMHAGRWKSEATLYDLAFAPGYPEVPYVYVCYHRQRKDGPFNTLARFRVAGDSVPAAIVESEEVLLEWRTGGHDGCDLEFGPDQFLYVSTGDGGQPRDPDAIGQRADNLLGSILRIDVTAPPDPGLAYAIPADNPFVGRPDARPEVWAYGLRNPWRMAFDAEGRLWVGDNGEELWEMIHLVGRGTNHGWSVYEGSHPFRPAMPLGGPTPVLTPPVVEHSHTEARSIIGGFVYTAARHPNLRGSYLYGDYVTGHHWAFEYRDGRVVNHRRLAAGPRFQAYGTDSHGHVYLLRNDQGCERLVAAERRESRPFPGRLSETGLFASLPTRQLAPGVHPYVINQPLWRDGAGVERFVAVPPGSQLRPQPQGSWQLPDGGVAGLTILLPDRSGDLRPIETQLIYHEANLWNFYTYAWDADGREAHLVPGEGRQISATHISEIIPEGMATRHGWRYQGRAECGICHTQQSSFLLGLTTPQLLRPDGEAGSLERLQAAGIVAAAKPLAMAAGQHAFLPRESPSWQALATGSDVSAADAGRLEEAARAYLHVQCAHCHNARNLAGRATLKLEWWLPTADTDLVDVLPVLGGFGLDDARLISSAGADRSVLLYRMASGGLGRMPPVGCETVDRAGLRLVARWIDSGADTAGRSSGVDQVGAAARAARSPSAALRLLLDPSAGFAADRSRPDRLGEIVAAARGGGGQHLRDLFSEWLPSHLREEPLGNNFDAAAVLAIAGDADRGRQLFFEAAGLSCRNCHQHGGQGATTGPDLSAVGGRLPPAEILEAIQHPSKKVAEAYRLWQVLTADGRMLTGSIARESAAEVQIVDSRGQVMTIPCVDIDERQALPESPMPANLLAGLTPQQAADLVAFLAAPAP